MFTEMALTARKFALTLAVAGIAAVGSVAIAPAASAAPPVAHGGGVTVVHTNSGGNGPDAFMIYEDGSRRAIFHCDPAQPMKRHSICINVEGSTRF